MAELASVNTADRILQLHDVYAALAARDLGISYQIATMSRY